MTVCIAVRVPGEGAVLACDSRVTCGTSVLTDECQKFILAGSAVALVSGRDGGLMDAVHGATSLRSLHKKAMAYTEGRDLNWDLLVYDRKEDMLLLLDSDGLTQPLGTSATAGCGGDLARGVLSFPSHLPTTLEGARKLVTKAARAAIRWNMGCGGRIRVVTVPLGSAEVTVK